jgi:hypothetical protein
MNLAIYNADNQLQPTTLLAETQDDSLAIDREVAASRAVVVRVTAGTFHVFPITSPLRLTPGRYRPVFTPDGVRFEPLP